MKIPRRKTLIAMTVIALVTAGVVGAVIYVVSSRRNTELKEDKKELFASLADSAEPCSGENISKLSNLYQDTGISKDKAELARELAHCYTLTQKYQEASTWYERAVGDFSKAGDTQDKELTQKALDHAKSMTEYKEIIDIEGGDPNANLGQN